MEFLHVLLGDEPVLTPEKHFYQRMLASDLIDARRVLEHFLQRKRLQELYDSVVIPALSMAQRDRLQNDLDETVADFIWQNTRELTEELSEEHVDPQGLGPDGTGASEHEHERVAEVTPMRIVCVPARTGGDETIAIMLTHLLEREGIQADSIRIGTAAEMIDQLVEEKPEVVVLSALQPFGVTHARKLYTQIRSRLPNIPILLGLWSFTGELTSVLSRLGPDVHSLIVTNFAAAVQSLNTLMIERRSMNDHHAIASL
jgi:methylmalonyl-CoA mutase cobalamin-binding subunit